MPEALDERRRTALSEPERLRDRRQDELGIGDRCQRDEEHALGEFLEELGGGLQPEPGLARASRPGERQQAHVLPPQSLGDRGQLALAPDQRRGQDGQVRGSVLERAQRRELARQPLDHELREPLRPGQVLEPVLTEVAQRDPVRQLVLDQLARRLRDHHLPAVTGRADPRGARHVEADVARQSDGRFARVDPDPDRQLRRRRLPLDARGRPDRAGRRRKRDEECITLRIDLTPARSANAARSRRRCSSISCAYSSLPTRASSSVDPFDVGEEERDRPGRQFLQRSRCDRQVERGIVLQDRLLEPLQRVARVEAELVDQRDPRSLVGGERVGLAARPVERQDQQLPQALPQGMLPDQRLQLRHDLGRPAERKIRLQTQTERHEPQLLQTPDLVAGERLVLDIGQSRAPPEHERAPKHTACLFRGATGDQRPAPVEQALESVQVEGAGLDVKHITGRLRLDHALAEDLAQLRDIDLGSFHRRGRRPLPPQRVDQTRGRHGLVRAQEKNGEHRPPFRPAERKLATVLPNREWTENAELHQTVASAPTVASANAAASDSVIALPAAQAAAISGSSARSRTSAEPFPVGRPLVRVPICHSVCSSIASAAPSMRAADSRSPLTAVRRGDAS